MCQPNRLWLNSDDLATSSIVRHAGGFACPMPIEIVVSWVERRYIYTVSRRKSGGVEPMKRDAKYYESRLRKEFPTYYADLVAKVYPSVRAASLAAGFIKPPNQVKVLLREWNKASSTEQADFLRQIGVTSAPSPARGAAAMTSATRGSGKPTPLAPVPGGSAKSLSLAPDDGQLAPRTIKRVAEIMEKRGLRSGDVMREIGFPPSNPLLGLAMARSTRIRDVRMRRALWRWLRANHGV